MASQDLATALAALAGAAAGGGGGAAPVVPTAAGGGAVTHPSAAAATPGAPLNLFAQLAAYSGLLQQAAGGVPPAGLPPAVPHGALPLPGAGPPRMQPHLAARPPAPAVSGESGGNRTTSSAYASRHQAAEQRRRNRINERLDRLRALVPGPPGERPNTAAFLERCADHILALRARVRSLEEAAGVPPSLPPPPALPPLTGTLIGAGATSQPAVPAGLHAALPLPAGAAPSGVASGLSALVAAAAGAAAGGGGGPAPPSPAAPPPAAAPISAAALQAAALAIMQAAAAAQQQSQAPAPQALPPPPAAPAPQARVPAAAAPSVPAAVRPPSPAPPPPPPLLGAAGSGIPALPLPTPAAPRVAAVKEEAALAADTGGDASPDTGTREDGVAPPSKRPRRVPAGRA